MAPIDNPGLRPLKGAVRRRVASRIKKAPGLFLFLDYDGTLTPIRSTPAQAVASGRLRGILTRLSEIRGIKVAVVSGRSVSDLDSLLGVDRVFRIGVHGLEFAKPGSNRVVTLIPRDVWEKRVRLLRRELDLALAGEAGVILEDKGLSLALHYRMVRPSVAGSLKEFFRDQFTRWPHHDEYELLQGKKVIEARPRGINKGSGVLRLIDEYGEAGDLVVYAGDDRTDEDAFKALKKSAVTIRVGGHAKNTCARYSVGSPSVLQDILEEIAEIREALFSERNMTLTNR